MIISYIPQIIKKIMFNYLINSKIRLRLIKRLQQYLYNIINKNQIDSLNGVNLF